MASLGDRPSLDSIQNFKKRDGKTINILQNVGAYYEQFGIHLLDDKNGAVVDEIIQNPREKAENIKTAIAKKWLGGVGVPKTWDDLAKVLDIIELKVLAQDVREAITHDREVTLRTLGEFEKLNGKTTNILKKIGADWRGFGTHLLKDTDGTIVDNIADDLDDRAANIKMVITKKWLRGKGRTPISWEMLATVLDTIDLHVLAGYIREALHNDTQTSGGATAPVASKMQGLPLGPRGTTLADSPGIAILVTCDYDGTSGLDTLRGTNEDAKEMEATFNHLNYVVHQLQNTMATKDGIEALLGEVSDQLANYSGSMTDKVIIFAFSGHGCNESQAEKIYANDGKKLDLMDEIVFNFVQHIPVAKIPKLFFIDACRGTEILTKGGGGGGGGGLAAKSDVQYFTKGVHRVEGNYRIDYSTIPNHVSYAAGVGSLWMPKLARGLKTQLDSFQNIADNVKKEVYDQLGDIRQQCESVSRLNVGALYLQK